MKRKRLGILLCCMTLGMSLIFGGCGKSDSTGETSGQSNEESDSEETTIYGQISAIDGDTITIALAEEPQISEGSTEMQPGEGFTMPEGSTELPEGSTEMQPGERPQSEEGSTEMQPGEGFELPEGSTELPEGSTEMQQNGKGGGQQGGRGLSLTGEEKTITVDDSTTITVQSGSDTKDGTIDDLAEEDIVTVVMNGDTVVSITVGGGMGGPGGSDRGNGGENNSTETTDTSTKSGS